MVAYPGKTSAAYDFPLAYFTHALVEIGLKTSENMCASRQKHSLVGLASRVGRRGGRCSGKLA